MGSLSSTCAAAAKRFSMLVICSITLLVAAANGDYHDDDHGNDSVQLQQAEEESPQIPDSIEQLLGEDDDETLSRTTATCKGGGFSATGILGRCLKSKRQCLKRKNFGWKLSMKGGRNFCGRSRHCCIWFGPPGGK